jgi:carbon monoxide dehydrogenase subunit G
MKERTGSRVRRFPFAIRLADTPKGCSARESLRRPKGESSVEIENEFVVDAPIQRVWEAMLDLERIAPCLPGASIEEAADKEYQGTMAVKLGPISARYRGTVKVEEAAEENHRAVLRADGKETRGQGSASATITSTLSEENGSTRVHVETDMEVAGRVAQFGRGIMQDVAAELMERFSTCVEQEIAGGGTEKEPEQAAEEEAETRAAEPRETEPLDLGDVSWEALLRNVSREVIIKRAASALAGLVGLGLTAVLLRFLRRPYFSVKFEMRKN